MSTNSGSIRTRWAAIGAAVAVTIGAAGVGGFNLVNAEVSTGDRPVFVPITPCRLTDTRPGALTVGPKTSPLGPAEVLTVTAHGSNGECTDGSAIPTDAVALSMNVTALNATGQTFLTFWGDGANPGTANLNPAPGQPPTPNAVNTPLSTAGTFNVFNERSSVDVVIDVNGYYAHHSHDDRYASRSLTLAVSIAGARAVGDTRTFTPDGCAVDSSVPHAVTLSVDLPVGAEVTGGRVSVRSEAGSMNRYMVGLYKSIPTETGNTQVTIAASLGAAGFDAPAITKTTHDFSIAANDDNNEIVGAGDSAYIALSDTGGEHSLCHVEIDYTLPSATP